jgi:DNA-binding CsgD family transcriptional regulator
MKVETLETKTRTTLFFLLGQLFYSCYIRATTAAPVFAQQIEPIMTQTVNCVALLATLTAFIVAYRKLAPIVHSNAFMIFATVTATLGALLLGLPYLSPYVSTQLSFFGLILVFVGQGALLVLIGESFSRVWSISDQRTAVFAAKAGAFLLFLIFLPLPSVAATAFVALFPAIIVLCLRRVFIEQPYTDNQACRTDNVQDALRASKGKSSKERILRQPGIRMILTYVVVFSVPLSLLRTVLSSTVALPNLDDWALIYAVTFIALIVIILLEVALKRFSIPVISLAIVLLTTIDIVLLLFFTTDVMTLYTLMNIGNALFIASFYCYLGSFILTSRYHPFRVFAFGGAANTIGLILGWALGLFVIHSELSSVSSLIVIGFLYVIFFTSIFVLPMIRRNFFDSKQIEDHPNSPGEPNIADSIRKRCSLVATAYQLSAREEELMFLMVRGKSLRLIADELVVSINTVKTHANHLYKKLEVHNKNEMLQLFNDDN